ncbi:MULTISPECIES: pantetheine-phosphate adenylyltransferase [Treponema]|nr:MULTISPECIES: pantetheine-phosphate adenylyltransferase [Treponema]MBQ5537785.1 pantetheine-phosphate adenylyltransferase [Treponema sp.]
MTKAIFPGSFDPPTNGHMNIIERASRLFDSIDVVIANNVSKSYLFSCEERLGMLRELASPFRNVTVHVCEKLIVEYARENGANILIRGIRNTIDFSYEFDLALMNRNLDSSIETVFIPTDQRYITFKSSAIKELASFGGDVSEMVPECVKRMIDIKSKSVIR